MIRDPSDGSVREPTAEEDRLLRKATVASGTVVQESIDPSKPLIDTATSGLPIGSSKPENLAKLEKSREWLKNYLHRKEPDHA